jgi:NTP pyrophosphatase (non-canonical NTP hydrolase)
MNRSNVKENVIEWAKDKGILNSDDKSIMKQSLKLVSEVGELSDAIIKEDRKEIIDAIGDVQVVLTILSKQLLLCEDDCFEVAYNVIKNRTGKTVDGVFIKD